MLKVVEDITVLSWETVSSATEEAFCAVECEYPFSQQPIIQVSLSTSESETDLPEFWLDSAFFSPDVFYRYSDGVIQVLLSPAVVDQFDPETYLFVKIVALGEVPERLKIHKD